MDTVLIKDADQEDIEELFSRLNAGESLNAAEQRRAIGGKMRDFIIEIGKHPFFTKTLSFKPKRYSNEEISAKIIRMEKNILDGSGRFADLKKKHLDEMVKNNKTIKNDYKNKLEKKVKEGFDLLIKIFGNESPHLSKQSFPQMYYYFCKYIKEDYAHKKIETKITQFFEKFRMERFNNLKLDENERNPVLENYSTLSQQATNDLGSMESRNSILRQFFLQWNPDLQIKDIKRRFDDQERYAIWVLAGKKCQTCKIDIKNLSEMDADHIDEWSKGGQTILSNAQCLCSKCNRSRKTK